MTWDTIVALALFGIACIYCIRKLVVKKSACSGCSQKRSCATYYNYKEIPTQCNLEKEKR